jgi:integrase
MEQATKRPRGTGSIYRPKGSSVYWIKFFRNGKPHRESSESDKVKTAEKLLGQRLAEARTDMFVPLKIKKILVEELAEDLIRNYRINGLRSIGDLEARWEKHLKPFFGELRAIGVNSALVAKYVDHRQEEGAANATINRELAALKRLFRLGWRANKVSNVPWFEMLREDNRRTGFLESKQHDALATATAKVGLWLRAMFETAYTFGWRKSELLTLKVSQVNLSAGTIRLEPGTTKNREGREATMTLPLKTLLTQCCHDKKPDDAVFTREDGSRVCDFRKTWTKVCEEAKVPALLFHDLRRSAARNLRNNGVAEGLIMEIGGWKTRSVFERYAIISQSDIKRAMAQLEAGQQRDNAEAAAQEKSAALAEKSFGHDLGIAAPETVQDSRISAGGAGRTAPVN